MLLMLLMNWSILIFDLQDLSFSAYQVLSLQTGVLYISLGLPVLVRAFLTVWREVCWRLDCAPGSASQEMCAMASTGFIGGDSGRVYTAVCSSFKCILVYTRWLRTCTCGGCMHNREGGCLSVCGLIYSTTSYNGSEEWMGIKSSSSSFPVCSSFLPSFFFLQSQCPHRE